MADFTISSGHFSVDSQAQDALDYLSAEHPKAYAEIRKHFTEDAIWEGSWLDTEAMGVDTEYGNWLIDAIEDTGFVYWEEGEPWAVDNG